MLVYFQSKLFFKNISQKPGNRHHVGIFCFDLDKKLIFADYSVFQSENTYFQLNEKLSHKKLILP